MITFSNKHRSEQTEIMDDLDFRGDEMRGNLEDIRIMNKWFGGNQITIDGLQKLLKDHSKSQEVTILDIGCGDGQILRSCADYANKKGLRFNCIGIDFNQNILELAQAKSAAYPNIKFKKVDIFLEENLVPNSDIALFTLFLHHFKDEKIESLLRSTIKNTSIGLIINDLHRNKVPFQLFKVISKVLLKTKTAHHDGLVSIARGFKKKELQAISYKIPDQRSIIKWQWAYRYQWIMKKTN